MRRPAKPKAERCPERGCDGGQIGRPEGLRSGHKRWAHLPRHIVAVIESNLASVYRCTHCGCEYVKGARVVILKSGTDMVGRA